VNSRVFSGTLAAKSPVFKVMLTNGMKESKEKIISVKAKNSVVFNALIKYFATGEFDPNCSGLDMMSLAHLYQMNPLLDMCFIRFVVLNKYQLTPFAPLSKHLISMEITTQGKKAEVRRLDEFSSLPLLLRTSILN